MEPADVEFIDENGGGPGIRLREQVPHGDGKVVTVIATMPARRDHKETQSRQTKPTPANDMQQVDA